MAARTRSVTLEGLSGRAVEIEVDIAGGLPTTVIVGLPDASVNEARDRCRAAVSNSGTRWPDQRVTINLAPSSLPKTGSHYDLAIAMAVVAAQDLVPSTWLHDTAFLGELALDGRLRAVRGVLPAAMAAADAGFTRVVVPEVNADEAALVPGIAVVGVRSLRHTIAVLRGEPAPDDPPVPPLADGPEGAVWTSGDRVAGLDLADVAGQEDGRLAVLVAAAGGHHLAMTGPPGIGKTMLAQRLPGLLPDLERREALEVSAVHSVAGLLASDAPLAARPPFVDPHHSASAVSVIGGGSKVVRPGALSLAHRGVLFMDEAPEFASNVIEALRQPLESGHVVVSRAAATVVFPARFQLIVASNPCPCGQAGTVTERCRCSPTVRRRYAERLSGPIRDRIDIHRTLVAPSRPDLARSLVETGGGTANLRALVSAARARQRHRYRDEPWALNAAVPGAEMRRRWPLSDEARVVIDHQVRADRLNPRSADRVLRLAWTVADLHGHAVPDADDVTTALALRSGAPLDAPMRALLVAS